MPILAGRIKRDPNCTDCGLSATCKTVCMLGAGPFSARVMIVGDAPGSSDDDQGTPFVGRAGKILDDMLAAAGIPRASVYVTNAVRCRPPDNRAPKRKEIKACRKWLMREIEVVNPKFVLILGATALEAVLDMKGIRSLRGRPIFKDDKIYFPTYHPSYVLRNPMAESVLQEDLRVFEEVIVYGKVPEESGLSIRVIQEEQDVAEFYEDLENNTTVSFDIETTGLDPWAEDAEIVTWGIGTERHQWILPCGHPESSWSFTQYNRIIRNTIKRLKASKTRIVAHYGKFDSKYTFCETGEVLPISFDTGMAHHVIDENAMHGLKPLAQRIFKAPNWDIGTDAKQGLAPLSTVAKYHAHDLFYTRKLFFNFQRELKQDAALDRLNRHLVQPAVNLLTRMEINGCYVNQDQFREVERTLTERRTKALAALDKLCPGVENWGSSKQVCDVLFGKLGLDPLDMTAGGQPSTSESVLKRLAAHHEVPKLLLEFREVKQQLSFFIDGWVGLLRDGYLHPSFKLDGTVTGRLSCELPNLQQVPRDPIIRSLISAPDGWEVVEADLSQVELRIAAELSQDPTMVNAFQTGIDLHWLTLMRELFRGGGGEVTELIMRTAKRLTNDKVRTIADALDILEKAGPDKAQDIDKAWKELRKKAKAINFGYLYGMWWKKFIIYARDNYGVDVTPSEAQESRKSFFGLYSKITDWHERQRTFVRRNGFVRSLAGRKRRLPDALGGNDTEDARRAERQAINSPVQGLASDWNVAAAIELAENHPDTYYQPFALVHDAILARVRKDKVREIAEDTVRTMRDPRIMRLLGVRMSVPIDAEVKIGPWGKGVDLHKWRG